MRIVITGGRGQLGRELTLALSPTHEIIILDVPECDITKRSELDSIVNHSPDLIVHAAALTDVDSCARSPDEAYRVNALGTQNVALACQRSNATMLYISTNEVFDGTKISPYRELDEPHAINPYGASKLAGERYVQMLLDRFYIVRTAWMFAPNGNNFPKKIIAAAKAKGNAPLQVVDDELGNPTYAPDLARALAQLIETKHYGIYHLTNEGCVSRYDYTARIMQIVGLKVPLARTKLSEYKRDSMPPRNGALANFAAATVLGVKLRHWDQALEDYFQSTGT